MAKAKEARVEIVLPDGTKVSARGPMAEQMARRLMDPQWRYVWPWYIPPVTGVYSSGVAGSLTVNGDPATPETVASAVASGLNGAGLP